MKFITYLGLVTVLVLCYSSILKGQNLNHSDLKITKIVAKNSSFQNEFGDESDWFEITNTSDKSLDLRTTKWFVSDDVARPRKFRLPKMVLEPNQSIIIWCDDEDRVKNQIHTNFKLSSSGEDAVLSKIESKKIKIVDAVNFPALEGDSQVVIHRTDNGLMLREVGTDNETEELTDSQ